MMRKGMRISFLSVLGFSLSVAAGPARACEQHIYDPTSEIRLSTLRSSQDQALREMQRINLGLPRAEDVARTWRLATQDDSQSCEISLLRVDGIAAGNLVSGFDCPDGMFNVVGWRLEGMELRFLSPTGRVMMRFFQTGNGWQGARENDGAVLVLWRTESEVDFFVPWEL